MMKNYFKGNKAIWFIFKITIVLLAFLHIIYKIKTQQKVVFDIHLENIIFLLGAVFLMPINWYVESLKWQKLLLKIQEISWIDSMKGVLAGVTSSMFSPNRAGEFFGKIALLNPSNRVQGTLLSFLGSISQLLVTMIFGCLAFIFYQEFNAQLNLTQILLFIVVFIILFALFLYPKLIFLLPINNWKFKKYLVVLGLFHINELIYVLFLSTIRYIIFSSQFFLMLIFFNVKISVIQAVICIPTIYLINTIIPSITFAELGVREVASVEIIGRFNDNFQGILSASLVLWFLNLVVPSIVGSYFLMKSKK
jgi:uncharacterized membrane protein YbhN (UPF0104 family)